MLKITDDEDLRVARRLLQVGGGRQLSCRLDEGLAQIRRPPGGANSLEPLPGELRFVGDAGRARAVNAVYTAIRRAEPDPTLVAILQLDALGRFADSDNSTIVVPYESAALLGAAQTLRSVLGSVSTNGSDPVVAKPAVSP